MIGDEHMGAATGLGADASPAPAAKSAGASRLEFANTLRGVAAFSVLVAHLGNVFWRLPDIVVLVTGIPYRPGPPPAISSYVVDGLGGWGVGLFFVISGFVIPFSLERYSVRGFVVGRLWRIWPTCWTGASITVVSVLLGVHFLGGTTPFTFRDVITHAFPPFASIADSRQIDMVMWTLEIEMFFYVVCALAVRPLREGSWKTWLVPVAIFAVWFAIDRVMGHLQTTAPSLARRLTYFDSDPPYIVFMFCGVALNFFQRGKLGPFGTLAAIAMCLGLFALTQEIGYAAIKSSAAVYAFGLALFVACMAGRKWIPDLAVFRFLSDISYPVYIIHGTSGFVVLTALVRAGWNPNAATAFTICLMVGLAYLVHRFVETPTHRAGQRMARRLSGELRRDRPAA